MFLHLHAVSRLLRVETIFKSLRSTPTRTSRMPSARKLYVTLFAAFFQALLLTPRS